MDALSSYEGDTVDQVWEGFVSEVSDLVHKIHVVVAEALAVLCYVLPSAIQWCWRVRISGAIAYHPLNTVFASINKTAWLFSHKSATTPKNGIAILYLHGDGGGHPYSLLPLIDRAVEDQIGHVYSIHLKYEDEHPEVHQSQLSQAIDKIEQAVRDRDGCFRGIIAVGHSRGALEAAVCAFADQRDERIQSVIAIAGRFKVTQDRGPRESLKPTVETIEKALEAYPEANLYQIGAGQDWCMPAEASLTVPDANHKLLIKEAMHLNVLYYLATLSQVSSWLRSCSKRMSSILQEIQP